MRTALKALGALALCGALLLTACGSSNGSTSCTGSGAPMDFAYDWTCNGSGCPDVGDLSVTSQDASSVSGFLILCVGNGSCTSFCMAGANSENSFTGTVSGNCINLTSTDGTWSASGVANGNNMSLTISSDSANCFGAQSRTVNVGH